MVRVPEVLFDMGWFDSWWAFFLHVFDLLLTLRQVSFQQVRKKVCILVVISRGRIVDISLIILMFSEMHVFSHVCIFDVFYEK